MNDRKRRQDAERMQRERAAKRAAGLRTVSGVVPESVRDNVAGALRALEEGCPLLLQHFSEAMFQELGERYRQRRSVQRRRNRVESDLEAEELNDAPGLPEGGSAEDADPPHDGCAAGDEPSTLTAAINTYVGPDVALGTIQLLATCLENPDLGCTILRGVMQHLINSGDAGAANTYYLSCSRMINDAHPAAAPIMTLAGLAAERLEQWETAAERFRRALVLDEDNQTAIVGLARVESRLRRQRDTIGATTAGGEQSSRGRVSNRNWTPEVRHD